jgi:integrase/recombinase XerD
MNSLRESLQDYLAMRRALGFKLRSTGAGLLSFVSFMEQGQIAYITTERALAWAQQPASVPPARWARRLSYVRGFARYCRAIDSRTEVPSLGLLPFNYSRPHPYFFTDDDIRRLLQASLQLRAKQSFVGQTFYCLLGLLSVSGLRIFEALGLTLDDVDLDEGILLIRSSKFGKSRLVPLHATTVKVLADYQGHRKQFLGGRQIAHFFVNSHGARLGYCQALDTFHRLSEKVGLHSRTGGRRPHLHDLRHRFALLTLLHWYRDGHDVERRLPVLSAYLGHVQVSDTYWYLSACPELLGAAKERLEQHWEHTS